METEKILSVSVACYNLGTMIEDNLRSFCQSPLADAVELLVVDDGSTDNSAEIVQRYVDLYPKTVKLIRQKNAGFGSTINVALQHATGKYFRIVDGDDWVDTDNLALYIQFMREHDVDAIISDFQYYKESKKIYGRRVSYNLPVGKVLPLANYKVEFRTWAMAYRTKLMQENKITVSQKFYADVEYFLYPVKYVQTIAYFNRIVCYYRIDQPGQSTAPLGLIKHLDEHIGIVNNIINDYQQHREQMTPKQRFPIKIQMAKTSSLIMHIFLYQKPSKAVKQAARDFLKSIKRLSPEIYHYTIRKSKLVFVLLLTGWTSYRILSKYFRKKVGMPDD